MKKKRRVRLRDRIYRPSVARALTSPAGLLVGAAAASGLLASGAPVPAAIITGAVAWVVPVLRAVAQDLFPTSHRERQPVGELPRKWAAKVEDAQQAMASYERAVARCPSGPLRDRLEALATGFVGSVERGSALAQWGAEAAAARAELDPPAVERAARSAGKHARNAAADQREVLARLDAVILEARSRLIVINGRLDEAVGRAVEIAGKADTEDERELAIGAGEVATRLRSLQAALEEVDGIGEARTATGEQARGTREAR